MCIIFICIYIESKIDRTINVDFAETTTIKETKMGIERVTVLGEMIAIELEASSREVDVLGQDGEPTGTKRTEYVVPQVGVVLDIGNDVKDAGFEIGDTVMLPGGNMLQLHSPKVIFDDADPETAEKYILTHYKNISVVYHKQ